MKIAIITIAGISSRFNEGINEDEKVLKCIYNEGSASDTLLYHLMKKCSYADRIILVGGYKFDDLCLYYKENLVSQFPDVDLIKNDHYDDYASGYSLYLGINVALKYNPSEILFVEGDLDFDAVSFERVVNSNNSVLTYTFDPIYAKKAVVLYQNRNGRYKYVFNSSHGLLQIDEPFSSIFNSGQIWKFMDILALKKSNDAFEQKEIEGTNLCIIQRYVDYIKNDNISIIPLLSWVNCNTRDDYKIIKKRWEGSEQ